MAEYDVTLWHGSGLTSPTDLRNQVSWAESGLGVKLRIHGNKKRSMPLVLSSRKKSLTPQELAKAFVELFDHDSKRMVICVDGGTGASRVAQYMMPAVLSPSDDLGEHIVVGASDSSVYTLWATLMHAAVGFYGVNFMGSRNVLLEALYRVREWVEEPNKRIEAFFHVQNITDVPLEKTPYTVVPACLRTLIQITGPMQRLLLNYLSSKPCLLLVEDSYPAGDLNWIGFYEDLTCLAPYIHAVAEGGGAIGFGPVPGAATREGLAQMGYDFKPLSTAGIVRDTLRWLDVQIPALCNVCFGHHSPDASGLVIASGARAKVSLKDNCLVLDEREGNALGCND